MWLILNEPKSHFLLSQVYNEQMMRLRAISDGVMEVQGKSDVGISLNDAYRF